MELSIARLYTGISAAKTAQSIQVAVMNKIMDSVEETGDQLVDLIDSLDNYNINVTV